jgi:DNA mismatch repair protein MutL
MNKIHILPEHEARKIAAGEVVERPASVVKELLENALDAGATEITLAIHDGGKKRISITDNGCGMSRADAVLSLEHHATSKIRCVDELSHITTFGFRGEALSSIASVSKVHLTTRQASDELGYEIIVAQGVMQTNGAVATAVGTQLIVDDLFENVPARKKFLKQRETEWRAIHQIVTAYALAFPAIGFTLRHDDELIYTVPCCATLLARAQQLFPRDIGEQLIPVEYGDREIKVEGVVTTHQITRYDRRFIFSFINQRWVKNTILGKAIVAGFKGMLPEGKFPVAALSLTIPSSQVDINVHPRKEEVLLMHPYIVSSVLEKAVSNALSQTTVRAFTVTPAVPSVPLVAHNESKGFLWQDHRPFEPLVIYKKRPEVISQPVAFAISEGNKEELVACSGQQTALDAVCEVQQSYVILGQLRATYLVLEVAQGLMIYDQHAAHEALLYHELSTQALARVAIKLLFPECVAFDASDAEHVAQVMPYLSELGIVAELWDTRHIMITAVAPLLQSLSPRDLIELMLATLRETPEDSSVQESLQQKIRHKLFALAACKKAVKAGDTLVTHEIKNLIDVCIAHPNILTCPHGRPIKWLIGVYDLEKWFKRV